MNKSIRINKYFILVPSLLIILILSFIGGRLLASPKLETVYMDSSWAKAYGTVSDLTSESDVVAVVRVTGVNRQYTVMSGVPMTDFDAEIITPIYGAEQDDNIVIAQTGGIQGSQKYEIRDDPLMEIGSEYLIFGRKNDLGTITILGGPQGRFCYENGKINNLFVGTSQLRSANTVTNFLAPDINFVNTDISEIIEEVHNYFN